MSIRKISLLLLSASLLWGGESMSLENAVMLAIQQNSSILQARNNTAMSTNNATAGNAGMLPTLALGGSSTISNTTFSGLTTNQTVTQAGLSVSQTLFSGFSAYYQYRILQLKNDIAGWQERQTTENILMEVASEWYTLLAARDNIAIARETLDISKERLLRSETEYSFGNSNKINLLNAQVDVNSDSLSYLNALESYRDAQRSFCTLLGLDPATELNPVSPPAEFEAFDKELLTVTLNEKNAGIQLANLSLANAGYATKTAQSAWSPSLTFSGGYTLAGSNTSSSFNYANYSGTSSAGLSLSFTLFNGGKRKTQTENAKITAKNTELQLQDTKLELRRSLESALSNYQTMMLKLETQQASLEVAQLNFDQSNEQYRLGQITSTQFREAQLNLLNSRTLLNQTIYNSKTYEAQIHWLTGSIIEWFGGANTPS